MKLFKATGYDSVQTIGGKGVGEEGFNFPTKICVPNRQSVLLLDYMNRRLVQLNTNLRIVSDLSFLTLDDNLAGTEENNLWPISFIAGPSGEFYLLNQEDLKIYKIIGDGSVERSFGGLDYGTGSVKEPWDLAINANNVVFSIDSTYQEVLIYDLFGTYQYRLAPPLPFRWHHAIPFDNALLLIGQQDIFYYDLATKQGGTVHIKDTPRLRDIAIGRDFLYVLFENQINLYAY